ncbi:MAG: ATP-binding protein [Eubacteriales bacterium]|uniref:ATP-binding protein n=1 Tax=Fenollaria sp. TaxID=1965292 RepID=UPI002A748697|nr:ATP-binding protein [Fenollaria sp.]MDD7339719.1 ATP-binding protein [Eubacteriales bacterium]MDY3106385.1 ATP-binding protein [Fenollaria sp.]
MKISRDKYLNDLIVRMHNGLIKVITGLRRSGKSYLLFEIFKDYLLENNISESHIIEISLDQRKNKKYRDPDTILDFIESSILDDDTYYVFLDEVQMLEDFEEVLNSLLHIKNVDIYVTGSNSRFLSKDIITEFRGRGDEIHIYPLTFKEFMQVYDGDKYEGLSEYIIYGGLPLVATMKNDEQKVKYLENLFEETYLKDIKERYKIEKAQEMDDLIKVLASSVGSLSNPSKIADTFKSSLKSDISMNTIKNYITYLEESFLINEANRYDVKGRKYIGTPLKYYFEDIGLRNAKLEFRQIEETHLMENIVYNELRARGFQVDVGMVEIKEKNKDGGFEKKRLEVDFIANKGSKKYYIQSAYSLATEKKIKQEKNSLLNINDSFKKIIIVKDVIKPQRDESGIVSISLYDFLLDENSLSI